MKKNLFESILTLGLVFGLLIGGFAKDGKPGRAGHKANLSNGWHKAKVRFENPTSFTTETYELQVRLENGSVNAIDFGNGSLLEQGRDTHYTWKGGEIKNDEAHVILDSNEGQETYSVSLF